MAGIGAGGQGAINIDHRGSDARRIIYGDGGSYIM